MFVPHVPVGALDLCLSFIAERAKLPANEVLEASALTEGIGLVWFVLRAGVLGVWFVWEYWMEKAKGYLQ